MITDTLNMFQLTGQVAIVTGGSGVYGSHMCLGLCEAGATVIVGGHDGTACEETAAVLRDKGFQAIGLGVDLRDEASIIEFIRQVRVQYGRIDILVNAAVSRYENRNLEHITRDGWDATAQVNGRGTILITREVVKQMREQEKGTIINVSSIMGVVAPRFPMYELDDIISGVEYTYNKYGMMGLTQWMAAYYGRYNIRVNCLSPGGNNLKGTKDEIRSQAVADEYLRQTPMGRFTDERDLKGPVVFLASEASRYMTGQNLIIDGGYTIW